ATRYKFLFKQQRFVSNTDDEISSLKRDTESVNLYQKQRNYGGKVSQRVHRPKEGPMDRSLFPFSITSQRRTVLHVKIDGKRYRARCMENLKKPYRYSVHFLETKPTCEETTR
ncbi:hypothetical protein X777_13468, partial [Ooceraea biroi]